LTKICYFSGTGNTLWSAKKIAEAVGGIYSGSDNCELVNIAFEVRKNELIIEADAVVILFPSYAYGLPLIVGDFLRKAEFKTPYAAIFVTHGTFPLGTLAAASRILKKKNIKSLYYGRIPAVENYIALFGSPIEKITRKRLAMHRDATEKAVRVIVERRTNRIVITFRPYSVLVSFLFSLGVKIFYRRYRLNDDCDGCRICEKLCPVSAITMNGNRPVFSSSCEHCQSCLNWCPKRAISFGRLKPNTLRYHHPEINVLEMMR